MARYTGPVCKLCRREGTKLFLKGDRCTSGKCALDRRSTVPGQHGAANKKQREYGMQLREKQKTKRYYGILEKQFHTYYEKAAKAQGQTGAVLLTMIETRLDNVAFRTGFCKTRREARQAVSHGHFTVNGKKVNIPSYLVKAGDVIAVVDNSKDNGRFKLVKEEGAYGTAPKWLEVNAAELTAKVVALPQRDDIDYPVEEHLIVEFYSK